MRIQFICKKNEIYGNSVYTRRSAGLFNSTSFIVKGLQARGVEAEVIEVQDNNCIDREVTRFRPDIVVIEALWVVPEKFEILKKLHPKVKWYIHLHSDMPFLALEGIAMDWIIRCAAQGIGIIANSYESYDALNPLVPEQLYFLPNVFIGEMKPPKVIYEKRVLDIACFGAVRPLKNHLLQALAAIQFARQHGKHLRFHINTGRVETGGGPVLKNLRQLFSDVRDAELVEVLWLEPDELTAYYRQNVDIGMQVSLTETFNVVSADYVVAGLPTVVSKEVKWMSTWNHAIDNSLEDIVKVLNRVWHCPLLIRWNQHLLKKNSAWAQGLWYEFVETALRHRR